MFKLLLCAVLWAYAGVSIAAPVTFSFAGFLIAVDAPLAGDFAVGHSFSGTITIDSNTPDSSPGNPNFGRYSSPNLALTVGGHSFADPVGPGGVFGVLNGFSDTLNILGDATGPTVAGLTPAGYSLFFADTSGTVFADDSFPIWLDLNDFDSGATFRLSFRDLSTGDIFGITGVINSFATTSVPEPGSVWLVFAALVPLLAARRRSRA
ncbi:PEP-CTERM sorting domain-containing protein [Aquincola sp. S2]|uniref:PEP-CTERM sorting domain-containing protein n=1 Tax=Pseudaquabacterium terrae TaxID=2732868 RepID=A0ABX2EMF4_9BURK|nr:PEP-CTERM sorting domain-containing protein [Aquabacterium terrae]NRF69699.1 PEP-CTERM sorting domain-containing protein [Aquabacterium terrae]